jgi:hypothetical protein
LVWCFLYWEASTIIKFGMINCWHLPFGQSILACFNGNVKSFTRRDLVSPRKYQTWYARSSALMQNPDMIRLKWLNILNLLFSNLISSLKLYLPNWFYAPKGA